MYFSRGKLFAVIFLLLCALIFAPIKIQASETDIKIEAEVDLEITLSETEQDQTILKLLLVNKTAEQVLERVSLPVVSGMEKVLSVNSSGGKQISAEIRDGAIWLDFTNGPLFPGQEDRLEIKFDAKLVRNFSGVHYLTFGFSNGNSLKADNLLVKRADLSLTFPASWQNLQTNLLQSAYTVNAKEGVNLLKTALGEGFEVLWGNPRSYTFNIKLEKQQELSQLFRDYAGQNILLNSVNPINQGMQVFQDEYGNSYMRATDNLETTLTVRNVEKYDFPALPDQIEELRNANLVKFAGFIDKLQEQISEIPDFASLLAHWKQLETAAKSFASAYNNGKFPAAYLEMVLSEYGISSETVFLERSIFNEPNSFALKVCIQTCKYLNIDTSINGIEIVLPGIERYRWLPELIKANKSIEFTQLTITGNDVLGAASHDVDVKLQLPKAVKNAESFSAGITFTNSSDKIVYLNNLELLGEKFNVKDVSNNLHLGVLPGETKTFYAQGLRLIENFAHSEINKSINLTVNYLSGGINFSRSFDERMVINQNYLLVAAGIIGVILAVPASLLIGVKSLRWLKSRI